VARIYSDMSFRPTLEPLGARELVAAHLLAGAAPPVLAAAVAADAFFASLGQPRVQES
jgi:hypothetical protein